MNDLFNQDRPYEPLASKLRPQIIEELVGQEHLLGPGCPLRELLDSGQVYSMILWGPPGVGKTTLARLIADKIDASFITLSAISSGVKEIREAVDRANLCADQQGRKTLLFVDEVHRFNKAQQDVFLPYIEDGTFLFIGATTENPSFELNNALLSRCKVHVLKPLADDNIVAILTRALSELDKRIDDKHLLQLAVAADGDARRALNLLELLLELDTSGSKSIDQLIAQILDGRTKRFDKGGDEFYDQISALHKSVRGSSPDAALYWLCRMLDGGCAPEYILRRMVRMASEDIGNADPRALGLVLDAWQAFERLGSPEGELSIAQALIYLAIAPKSNAAYKAWGSVKKQVDESGSLAVPLRLRNAATKLMKELGYGENYRYAHDEEAHYAAGENYFPDELGKQIYYYPSDQGIEQRIAERLKQWSKMDDKQSEKLK